MLYGRRLHRTRGYHDIPMEGDCSWHHGGEEGRRGRREGHPNEAKSSGHYQKGKSAEPSSRCQTFGCTSRVESKFPDPSASFPNHLPPAEVLRWLEALGVPYQQGKDPSGLATIHISNMAKDGDKTMVEVAEKVDGLVLQRAEDGDDDAEKEVLLDRWWVSFVPTLTTAWEFWNSSRVRLPWSGSDVRRYSHISSECPSSA